MSERFKDSRIVKQNEVFIDKSYSFDSKEHVGQQTPNDFNVLLYEIGNFQGNASKNETLHSGVRQIKSINISDFIGNYRLTRGTDFEFYLSDILNKLRQMKIENITILDFACSSFYLEGNTTSQYPTNSSIIGRVKNTFKNREGRSRKRESRSRSRSRNRENRNRNRNQESRSESRSMTKRGGRQKSVRKNKTRKRK